MIKESDQPYSICAIDASTNSLAFAIYSDKNLIEYGKINFEGNNVYEKIIDACKKSTWQSYLGNKKLTKEEQLQIRSANPKKSTSWYKTYERDFRKQRTIKLLDVIYDKKIDDYDVADACGIGHWAINNWEKAIGNG